MNRPIFIAAGLVACAAAAFFGWKMAAPIQKGFPRPVSQKTAPPLVTAMDYTAAAGANFGARNDRPISDILAAIDRLRLDPFGQASPDDSISGELFALLYSLQPDEIPGVLAHLTALPPPSPDKLLAAVLGCWAQTDGTAAMKWAQRLTPSRQDTVRGDILSGWAQSNPRAAWDWYKAAWEAAPGPRYRLEQDFVLLIHAWALRDAKGALDVCLAEGKHGTFDAWAGFGSLAGIPERRDEVMKLIGGITDEKARAAATRSALLVWAASAPVDAAAWLDANMPDADGNLLWSVAERYGRANPRANADWLLKRTPPDKRDEAYRLCLYQWAEVAPDEAAAWLETAGPTDMSVEAIAGRFARTDVDRAVSWAQRISPAKRTEAIANTLARARTAGKTPDISKYAAAAGVSAGELGKLVDKAVQIFGSRL